MTVLRTSDGADDEGLESGGLAVRAANRRSEKLRKVMGPGIRKHSLQVSKGGAVPRLKRSDGLIRSLPNGPPGFGPAAAMPASRHEVEGDAL